MALAKRHLNLITLSFVLLALAFFGMALLYDSPPKIPAVQTLKNWQEADAPPGYPVEVTETSAGRVPAFNPRFVLLDAFERFTTPLAAEFDAPLGTESGALGVREAAFGTEVNGQRLLGDVLGGIGGGDSDLGDPVRAIGNGLVLFAGEAGPPWGRVLILSHRTSDGRLLQSFYGHLRDIKVPRGEVVARGQVIASVGTGGAMQEAALHFELRESDAFDLGAPIAKTAQNRLDPALEGPHYRAEGTPELAPEPLAFRDQPRWEDRLILTNPDKARMLFGDD